MEGFEVHFQCWLVVDVDFGTVFFVDLLPPTTIVATSTLPPTYKATVENTDHELVVRAKGYGLLTTCIWPILYRASEGRGGVTGYVDKGMLEELVVGL